MNIRIVTLISLAASAAAARVLLEAASGSTTRASALDKRRADAMIATEGGQA
jgi:hypothetical protein